MRIPSKQSAPGKELTVMGERVYLRPLTQDDASSRYASWLNDPVVNQYLETRSVTLEDLRQFIAKKNASPQSILWGVFCKQTDQHIGNVKLEPIDWKSGIAMMGILIGDKEYWGKGIGTEVTDLVTNTAFNKLMLVEVNLGVIPENKAAIRVYEKCGFAVRKVNKNAVNHNGVLYDQVIMMKRSS